MNFRWEVTDGTNVYGYGTGSAGKGSPNGATVLTGLGSTETITGDGETSYYIRLYPYSNTDGNTFRIGKNVILKGTTASSCTAPSSVGISGTWHLFKDSTLTLTATAYDSGSEAITEDVTYQWYKGGTEEGNKIAGATSATYTKSNCDFDDAGYYYCKATKCGTTATSSGYGVKMLRIYVKTGKDSGGDYGSIDPVPLNNGNHEAQGTIRLAAGSYTYGFGISDGCNNWSYNSGTMISSNCTDWNMDKSGGTSSCGLTSTNFGIYTFTLKYGNLYDSGTYGGYYKVSVNYPTTDQAAGKIIYFDNSTVNWSNLHWRIGQTGNTVASAMSLVPGTANLYKVSTSSYGSLTAWHIANQAGWTGDLNSIYKTNTGDGYAITKAIEFDGGAVTDAAITIIPKTTPDPYKGGEDQNNNCDFHYYDYKKFLWTHTATVGATTNGSIRLNWTDISNTAQNATETTAGLAHTCNLQITAVPATGYETTTLTVNGSNHTSGNVHVLSADATIAATFSLVNYNVTYSAPSNGSYTIKVADGGASSASKTATMGQTVAIVASNNTGYSFSGWTIRKTSDASDVTSTLLTGDKATTASTSFTMPAYDVTITAAFTLNSHTLTWNLAGGTVTTAGTQAPDEATGSPSGSVNYGATVTAPVVTKTGYTFSAWSPTVVSPMPDENKTYTATWSSTAPTISGQPSNVSCNVGDVRSISVTSSISTGGTPTYQWQESDDGSSGWANVASGGTSDSYTVPTASAGTKYYHCVVTNPNGSATTTSNTATVTVTAAAGTTYYLVTSTAQLNATDTYIIANSDGTAVMSTTTADTNKNPDDITTGFSVDGSTLTVTSASPNLFKLTSATNGWLFRGGNGSGNYISSNGTPGADLWYNTSSTPTNNTGEWAVSFASGIATMKLGKATETTYHIYYDATNTKFIQSTTASNIKIYTSNSTPVDVTAPTLSSSTPEDDATGVGVSGNIVLTFSENVTINDASKFTLTGGAGTLNTASASASGAVVTIPYAGLAYNTTYTLATAAEAVKDGSNNKNAALSDITFTTLSATGSCNEQNYVWQTGSSKTPKGVSHTYADGDVAMIDNDEAATTHITISGTNYAQKEGSKGSLNLAKAKNNYFLLTAASGYVIDSVYFYAKLEDGACRMSTDGSAWTTTLGDGSTGEKVYAIGVGTQYFGLKNNDEDSPAGVWIRTMMVKVCPAGTTYTVNYDANGHGSAPDAETEIDPGSNISAPSAPSADCWTFGGWYKERACTNVWNFAEDEVNSNITLYAKWTSNKARVKSMNYGETNYTVTAEGTADAITVTPVSTTGVTYTWLTNTTDDARTASVVDGASTASYSPSIASVGTNYYWAVLVHDCGNDTTSSVRIHVAAVKTNPTIVWDNVQLNGDDTDPTYGGGGYTLTGTINAGNASTPTLTTDMISADGGIVITDKSVTDAGKTFSLTFDVTAAFDTTQAKLTNIHFSLPSNSTYNDSVFSTNLSYGKCSGGGGADPIVWNFNSMSSGASFSTSNPGTEGNKNAIAATTGTAILYYFAGSGDDIKSPAKGKPVVFYINGASSSASIGGGTKYSNRCFYLDITSNGTLTITNHEAANGAPSYQITDGTRPGTSGYTAKSAKGTGSDAYVYEIPVTTYNASTANRIWVVYTSSKPYINNITWTPAGSGVADAATTTALQWKSGKAPSNISGWNVTTNKLEKAQSDDNFTCVAEQTSATNSVGAITYASSDVTVATVNATTGEVDIVAGAAGGEATITATMARSGCFKAATLSYTISVPELVCDIKPGTLTASATSKCTAATVTLTLSDYTSTGTTISWYKSGTAEPLTNGETYTIAGATLTTAQEGTYYAKVTLSESGCSLTSNNVTITNKSGAASVSKLVNQWYIKKGRVTPDVALFDVADATSWTVKKGKAATAIYTSDGTTTTTGLAGVGFKQVDNIVYLEGTAPTGIDAAANDTIIITVTDACGNPATSDSIVIHKQVATDKHELAFVTIGTNYSKKEFTEDAWTDGIKSGNSTSLALYQLLKDTFKIQATNIYASDDEQKIREYYSQYDLICITDYPNTGTKGKNSKSYVDAIGSLIDIRPVLTMEAWVSGLDNWRAKGVVGTRTTPSARQYNMFLQCKDHEIFEGVRIEQIGYGDDALFKVNMVDSTESRYVELDAVSKSSHASDTAALQGFTTGEMDLLALGYISNGSGGVLQVGAERQEVMKARMMVLGINSYAMERLSDDGLRVVLNALQYLTKKRAEDISDCSSYFIGGASGHENEWGWAANWRSGTIPTSNQEARIAAPVTVSDTRKIASVKVVAGGTLFDDIDARGSITIAPTGALIVEDKIQRSIAPNVMSGSPTQSGDIIIETTSAGQGALMLNNDDERTQATVKLYSKGCNDGNYKFQYFASPFNSISSWAFDAYIYNHSETLNPEWTQLRYGEDVEAFQGLALTADGAAKSYEIAGTLASTQPHVYELSYTSSKANNKKGTNVVGNSWSAPIQITRIETSDFNTPSNFEGTVYIYNAGRDVLVDGKVYASNGNNEAGQWESIPIETAKTEAWTGSRQIPAFQAFQMKVSDATEFTLDYDKHVRQAASVGDDNLNKPLRAPRHTAIQAEDVEVLRLCVEDEQVGKSYIYLCEGDEFTEDKDRGWEAQQTVGSGKYGKLYAIDQANRYMMSIARPWLEGTPVGFICGQSTEYTITFNETEGTYYLNDMETQQSTLIQEGESYTFTTTKGNHPNRFIISAIPFDKPGIATGVTDLDAEAPKVQKVIYNDKLYIIRGGKVFSADGQLVR